MDDDGWPGRGLARRRETEGRGYEEGKRMRGRDEGCRTVSEWLVCVYMTVVTMDVTDVYEHQLLG